MCAASEIFLPASATLANVELSESVCGWFPSLVRGYQVQRGNGHGAKHEKFKNVKMVYGKILDSLAPAPSHRLSLVNGMETDRLASGVITFLDQAAPMNTTPSQESPAAMRLS